MLGWGVGRGVAQLDRRQMCLLVAVCVCLYVCMCVYTCMCVCMQPPPSPHFKKVNLSLASLQPLLLFELLPSLLLLELFFYMSAPIAMQEVCLLGAYLEMYMCDTSIQTHRSTSPIINIKEKSCRALSCAPSGSCITLLSFLLTLWLFIL